MKYLILLLLVTSNFAEARKKNSVDFISLEKDYENLIRDTRYKGLASSDKIAAKKDIEALINGKVKRKHQEQAVYIAQQKIAYARLRAEEEWLNLALEEELAKNNQLKIEISKTETKIARHEAEITRLMLIAQQEEAERILERAKEAESVAEDRLTQVETSKLELESAKRYAKAKEEQAELAQLEAELALEEAESLKQKLEELRSTETANGLMMTLGDYVFDSGKSTIKSQAVNSFSAVMEFVGQHPNNKILVEGHTDSSGSKDLNMKLSQKRADAVTELLISNGIDSTRIESKGRGEDVPISSNSTREGKAKNRRVNIIILPN